MLFPFYDDLNIKINLLLSCSVFADVLNPDPWMNDDLKHVLLDCMLFKPNDSYNEYPKVIKLGATWVVKDPSYPSSLRSNVEIILLEDSWTLMYLFDKRGAVLGAPKKSEG